MTRLADFARLLAGRYGDAPRAVPKPGGIDAAPAAMLPERVLEDLYWQPSLPIATASRATPERHAPARQPLSDTAEEEGRSRSPEPAEAAARRSTQRDETGAATEIRSRSAPLAVAPSSIVEVVAGRETMADLAYPQDTTLRGNAKPSLPPTLQALTTIAQRGEAEIKSAAEAPPRPAEVEPAPTRAGPDAILPPADFARPLPQAAPQIPMPASDARMRPAPTPSPVAPTLSIGRINIKVVAARQPARKVETAPSVSRSASIAWRRAGVGKL